MRRNCRRGGAVRYMEVKINSEPAVVVGMESGQVSEHLLCSYYVISARDVLVKMTDTVPSPHRPHRHSPGAGIGLALGTEGEGPSGGSIEALGGLGGRAMGRQHSSREDASWGRGWPGEPAEQGAAGAACGWGGTACVQSWLFQLPWLGPKILGRQPPPGTAECCAAFLSAQGQQDTHIIYVNEFNFHTSIMKAEIITPIV